MPGMERLSCLWLGVLHGRGGGAAKALGSHSLPQPKTCVDFPEFTNDSECADTVLSRPAVWTGRQRVLSLSQTPVTQRLLVHFIFCVAKDQGAF